MMDYVEKHGVAFDEHGEAFDAIKKMSRLRYDHTTATMSNDPFHIDYKVPDNDIQKWHDYVKFVAEECCL